MPGTLPKLNNFGKNIRIFSDASSIGPRLKWGGGVLPGPLAFYLMIGWSDQIKFHPLAQAPWRPTTPTEAKIASLIKSSLRPLWSTRLDPEGKHASLFRLKRHRPNIKMAWPPDGWSYQSLLDLLFFWSKDDEAISLAPGRDFLLRSGPWWWTHAFFRRPDLLLCYLYLV